MLPSLFAALATMRTVDLSATKGFGGWDSTGNASSSSWREYLLAVDQDTPSLRTRVATYCSGGATQNSPN